jgi:spermidine synthase
MATLSGAAGLGYEMVWTRSFTTALGHELTSVLAVLSAFFIGMALGAWALHGRLSRSTYPAKWYAFFEAIIGIWALLLAYYLPTISAMAVTLLGDDPSPQRQWLIAFAVPAFSLLPATLAMGATLPALERWMSQYSSDGWVMGGVYAANT